MFMVDRGFTAPNAVSVAWSATEGQWGKLAAIVLLMQLLALPANVLVIGLQYYMESLGNPPDPDAMIEALPVLGGIYLGLIVLGGLAGWFGWMFFVAAYRQISGPMPASSPAA